MHIFFLIMQALVTQRKQDIYQSMAFLQASTWLAQGHALALVEPELQA